MGLVSLLLTVGGVFMAEEEPLKGWLITSFFGLCLLIFSIQLIPGSTQLTLTKEGFKATSLFRGHFTKWSDIEGFKVGYVGKTRFVKFDYTSKHKKHKIGKGLAKFLSGNHGALPNTYGLTLKELCELMNEWKSRTQLEK